MCNWIRTIEVCPTCDSKQKTRYADFQCESNFYPVRQTPFYCKSYRQISNEIIADSPCINCEELISVFEDSDSREDDQKTGTDSSINAIGMSMKNNSIGEASETVAVDDVSEDECDSDDRNMSDVSEVSALSDEDGQDHEIVIEGLMTGQIQYDDDTLDLQGSFGEPDLVEEESPVESPFLARIEMLRREYD
ncbi:hypothetical protein BPAE_0043g00510 [Botrytis paeoniae]|uniref:Uncharacterized protein n=1 Tax=Botrytis paeoniae TaxID=278948 RepID=A0A4Z1FZY9_9HELO|nr:hypothetical protein BPAE_0043g00510 [Botrytis paeoniae]